MKRALVTGGSGDIGSAICKRLASDGLRLLVHANERSDRAEAVATVIRDAGGEAETIQFDITKANNVRDTLERLLDAGPIQVVVHNAGRHQDVPMAGMTENAWKNVLDISLNGFFNITQPLLLPMLQTRWGRVIAISSIAGITGNRGQANYAAAKSGLHGAIKSLAIELASRGVTAKCRGARYHYRENDRITV